MTLFLHFYAVKMEMTTSAAENVLLNVEVQKIWLHKRPLNEVLGDVWFKKIMRLVTRRWNSSTLRARLQLLHQFSLSF